MSLTSSLWNGASGLDASSLDLQVIGDNISNSNTVGFKNSRADFEAQISQNLIGGQGQVGLGTELQTVQKIMTQGSIVTTNVATDLALQGNGLFLVNGTFNGVTGQFFTRNGQFTIDKTGDLVNQSGLQVQGYSATATGAITGNLGNLQVGNATSPPQATANVTVKANLDSTAPVPAAWAVASASTTSNFSTSTTVYDSLGNAHQVQIYFRHSGAGAWSGTP